MIHTLYLSDIDGTLLQDTGESLPGTLEYLAQLARWRVPLALATGRRVNASRFLWQAAGGRLPLIVLNGALVYDPAGERALASWPIPQGAARRLCALFEEFGLQYNASVYLPGEGRCRSYFNFPRGPWHAPEERTREGLLHDEMRQVRSLLPWLGQGKVLYIGADGPREGMAAAYRRMQQVEEVKGFLHQSAYHPEKWFLDVVAAQADKGRAALFVKQYCQARELVAFGDNLNDLPLLQAADRSYAMARAPRQVREAATAVLPEEPFCVPRFLLGLEGLGRG